MLCLSVLSPAQAYPKNRFLYFEIHPEQKSKNDLRDFLTTLRKPDLRIDDMESNSACLNSGFSVYSIFITMTRAGLKKQKAQRDHPGSEHLEYVSHIEGSR